MTRIDEIAAVFASLVVAIVMLLLPACSYPGRSAEHLTSLSENVCLLDAKLSRFERISADHFFAGTLRDGRVKVPIEYGVGENVADPYALSSLLLSGAAGGPNSVYVEQRKSGGKYLKVVPHGRPAGSKIVVVLNFAQGDPSEDPGAVAIASSVRWCETRMSPWPGR